MTTPLLISEFTWDLTGPKVNLGDLFARIPDDIVLAVSARDLELGNASLCLCGWTLREQIARTTGRSADDVDVDNEEHDIVQELSDLYGGTWYEWYAVFLGVTDSRMPTIELAWLNRIDEALEIASTQPIKYNRANRKVVLPADVYDALELSALAFGGIGGGKYVDPSFGDGMAPVCAIGHAGFGVFEREEGGSTLRTYSFDGEDVLRKLGIDEGKNDAAVARINKRKGVANDVAQVTFEEWAGELNVRRGEAAH